MSEGRHTEIQQLFSRLKDAVVLGTCGEIDDIRGKKDA